MARENKRHRDGRRFGSPERLADIFISTPAEQVRMTPAVRAANGIASVRYIQAQLEKIPCIVADNVIEYYAENPQEYWEYSTDFPTWAPPFQSFLIDMKGVSRWRVGDKYIPTMKNGEPPPQRMGILFEITDAETVGHQFPIADEAAQKFRMTHLPEAKWFVKALPLYVFRGAPVYVSAVRFFAVDAKGGIVSDPQMISTEKLPPGRTPDEFCDEISQPLLPAMLAVSFMNCKNVATSKVEPNVSLNRYRRKAGLKPFLRYHTINIEPMKKTLKTEGDIEANGLKKALHICRGHFATYSEDRPLFGHFSGTVWKPSHVRGSAKEGVIISDYKVNPPGTSA